MQGMVIFQSHKWPRDFHYSLYQELTNQLQDGVNTQFWEYIVPILSGWKAIRPKSRRFISQQGLQALENVNKTRMAILKSEDGTSPSIEYRDWHQVKSLFEIAVSIKDVNSPVFASKLCHFLLPNVYPVADREVININNHTYKEYWKQCKQGWISCECKEDLIDILLEKINPQSSPYVYYPWATKITELCYMGHISKL